MKVVLTDYAYDTLQPFSDVYQAAGVEFIPLQCKSKQEVLQATEYADGVMTHYAHIDREVIDNLKNCKIIIRSAVCRGRQSAGYLCGQRTRLLH